MTLSGKTFFAHVIRNIKMRDCLGLCRWALHVITSVLIRKTKRDYTKKRRGDIYGLVEIGVLLPEGNECQ